MKKHILTTMVLSMTICMVQGASADAGALASSRSASSEEEGRGVRVVAVPVAPPVVSTLAPTAPPTLSFPYVPRVLDLPAYESWTNPLLFEEFLEREARTPTINFHEMPDVIRCYYKVLIEQYAEYNFENDPIGSEMIRYISRFSGDEHDVKGIQDFINRKDSKDFSTPMKLKDYMRTRDYTPLSKLYETLKQAKQTRDEEDYTIMYAQYRRTLKWMGSLFSAATPAPRGYTALGAASTAAGGAGAGGKVHVE